jgi:hypothetical protein
MRVLLHIGTDKTGSTAIQQHLYLNRRWLEEQGVYLPREGLGSNNGYAALFETENSEGLARLSTELAAAERLGFRQAVVSWEGLSTFGSGRIKRLRDAFAGQELSLLVYLREQADILQSGYLQQVKFLIHLLPLSAFESPRGPGQRIRSWRARTDPSRDYFRLLERWRRALAPADMSVRIFDSALLHKGDVIDDFLLQLAIQPDANFVRLSSASNVSLDVETAVLVNRWQEEGVSAAVLTRRIDASLSILAAGARGEKYFLSTEVVSGVRAHYRRSNQRVAQHYLGDSVRTVEAQKTCWPQCSDTELSQRVNLREQEIISLSETPVHSGPLLFGPAIEQGVALLSGWQTGESWGWWSEGDTSQLRLRIPFQHLLPIHEGIRLFIKGRYYGDNRRSNVVVNAVSLGEHHLSHDHGGLLVKVAELLPHQMLEIEISHGHPASPRQYEQVDDDRELAFGIESIGYDLVSI